MKILRNRLLGNRNELIATFKYDNDDELHGCHISKEAVNLILTAGEFTKRADECPDKGILSRPGVTVEILKRTGMKGDYNVDVIHIPVSTEEDAINILLWAANQDGCRVRIDDPEKPQFSDPEDLPDTAETKELITECFKPEFQTNLVIDGQKNIIEFNGSNPDAKPKAFYKPTDELPVELSDLDKFRTPEIKQAYLDSLFKPDYLNRSERDVAGTTATGWQYV